MTDSVTMPLDAGRDPGPAPRHDPGCSAAAEEGGAGEYERLRRRFPAASAGSIRVILQEEWGLLHQLGPGSHVESIVAGAALERLERT